MAPLSKKVIAWVAVGISVATVALVVVLWWAGTRGLEGEKLVAARFDALRTGLSIGLGCGGLFALYLAWRRQHSTEIGLAQKQQDQADVARAYALQERTALASEADAAARRITDLYTKAVEQLGSEKAPVRLGGLYALERLAQDHVEQRQTIVNVLCAYLRMPYTLPGDPPTDNADDKLVTAHRERTQEREVRLAAERILTHHLRPGDAPDAPVETFWADIELDLTSATLIKLNLTGCTILNARFNYATFTDVALFGGATFTGKTLFGRTTFTNQALFNKATFTGTASFGEATFANQAVFDQVTFRGHTSFAYTTFAKDALFQKSTFRGDAQFFGTTFMGKANFSQATLPNTRCTHTGDVSREPYTDFCGARFTHDVPPEVERFVSQPGEEVHDGEEAE